jgi:aminoacrylate hydrolase
MPHAKLRDGEPLYYETHGSGPHLLLVSGLGGVATFWEPHVEALARHFTVVLHDHRGCARSAHTRMDYSVAQMSDDVLALMDSLGIASAHLVGHSTGGAIGQTLALDHPSRIQRLVLSATWSVADDYMRRVFENRVLALEKMGAGFYGRMNILTMYPPWWLSKNLRALEEAQARSDIPKTPDEIVKSRIAAIMAFDRVKDLPRIRHRSLVVCARDDIVTPLYLNEALARDIPDARLAVLPTGGHFYNHVCRAEFERLILDFLTSA